MPTAEPSCRGLARSQWTGSRHSGGLHHQLHLMHEQRRVHWLVRNDVAPSRNDFSLSACSSCPPSTMMGQSRGVPCPRRRCRSSSPLRFGRCRSSSTTRTLPHSGCQSRACSCIGFLGHVLRDGDDHSAGMRITAAGRAPSAPAAASDRSSAGADRDRSPQWILSLAVAEQHPAQPRHGWRRHDPRSPWR